MMDPRFRGDERCERPPSSPRRRGPRLHRLTWSAKHSDPLVPAQAGTQAAQRRRPRLFARRPFPGRLIPEEAGSPWQRNGQSSTTKTFISGAASRRRRCGDYRPSAGTARWTSSTWPRRWRISGGERRDAVRSQLRRLIEHCLKIEHSPATDLRAGWLDTIDDARDEIAERLTATIRRDLETHLPDAYARALRRARKALVRAGEPEIANTLPEAYPYALEQLIDET